MNKDVQFLSLPLFLLFNVKHLLSFGVHGAERKHGVSEERGEKREQLEEEPVRHRHQQVSVFRPGRHDRVLHGADDQAGVFESRPAR